MSMLTAYYHGQEDVRLKDVDRKAPGPDEVQLEPVACGICGTDMHEYLSGPIFMADEPNPVTGDSIPVPMGHEFGGTVTNVGADVTDVTVGDKVAVNPVIPCKKCRYCHRGKYHLCEDIAFVGFAGIGGGFSESTVIPEENAVLVPEEIPDEYTALIEPLTVGTHAVRKSEMQLGDSVAVFGSGPIGLIVIQAAKAAGASEIYVSEPVQKRRELAEQMGATTTLDPTELDVEEYIRDETNGGVDKSFEVAGVEQSYNQAIKSTRADGDITVIAVYHQNIDTNPNSVVFTERTVNGMISMLGGPLSDREMGMTLGLIQQGVIDPEPLITSKIPLKNLIEDGFEEIRQNRNKHIKILVKPDGNI